MACYGALVHVRDMQGKRQFFHRVLSCPQAKMQALEDQVQGLQEKLKALEIERAHNTAQLDALSQCVRGMELAPRPDAGPESSQEVCIPTAGVARFCRPDNNQAIGRRNWLGS